MARKLLGLACAATLMIAAPAGAQDRYGVTTSDHLVRFDPAAPTVLKLDVPIAGIGDVREIVTNGGRLFAQTTDGRVFWIRQTDGSLELPVGPDADVWDPETQDRVRVRDLFGTPEPNAAAGAQDTALVETPSILYARGRSIGGPALGGLYEGRLPEEHYLQRLGDPLVAYSHTVAFFVPAGWSSQATPGVDFHPMPITARFPPGELFFPLPNPIVDDDIPDEGEDVCLAFDVVARGCNVLFMIFDNGDAQFTVGEVEVTEEDSAAVVEVRRAIGTGRSTAATVDVVPRSGTATAGSDFAAGPIRVDFAYGEAVKRVRVPLVDDGVQEPVETLTAVLQQAGGGRVLAGADKSVTVTVRDGDAGVTAAVRDRTAPVARLATIARTKLRRTLQIPFNCSEACTARVELRVDAGRAKRLRIPVRIARGSGKATGLRRARIAVRLSKTTLARLRRARNATRVTVVLTAADAAGNTRVTRKALTLTR